MTKKELYVRVAILERELETRAEEVSTLNTQVKDLSLQLVEEREKYARERSALEKQLADKGDEFDLWTDYIQGLESRIKLYERAIEVKSKERMASPAFQNGMLGAMAGYALSSVVGSFLKERPNARKDGH